MYVLFATTQMGITFPPRREFQVDASPSSPQASKLLLDTKKNPFPQPPGVGLVSCVCQVKPWSPSLDPFSFVPPCLWFSVNAASLIPNRPRPFLACCLVLKVDACLPPSSQQVKIQKCPGKNTSVCTRNIPRQSSSPLLSRPQVKTLSWQAHAFRSSARV